MKHRSGRLGLALAAVLVVACSGDAMSIIGDAAVDLGEAMRDVGSADAAQPADGAPGDASGMDSAVPTVLLTADCVLSSNGTSRIAQWSNAGIREDTSRVSHVRLCGVVDSFGPPEAFAQECATGFGAFLSDGSVVVPCLSWSRAEVELEL